MNLNQARIFNHVLSDLLIVPENTDEFGNPDFDFIEADIHLDIKEGKLDAQIVDSDIDMVFTALHNGDRERIEECIRCGRPLCSDICGAEFVHTGICSDCA